MINKLIANIVGLMPERLVWIFSKRYIAGKTLDDAVAVVEEFNRNDVLATIDVLGELVNSTDQSMEYQSNYIDAISTASDKKLSTSFSLKPSMFDLQNDFNFCYLIIRQIVQKAQEMEFFVRIDMEDSTCTDSELELFRLLYEEFPETVGIVIQSYLKRSAKDVEDLVRISKPEAPINIRLCKGIYVESPRIAYKKKKDINDNFIRILDIMLANRLFAAIATHDKDLVAEAELLLEKFKTPKQQYEFQMLYGVTPMLRGQLVTKGHPMRIYVPYGKKWFNYSTRRLQENPQMVKDIIAALFIRK